MKNSILTIPVLSRGAYGYSAVSLRVLSRRPSLCSAVKAYGYSAVTIAVLSRQRTAEYPCKHRLLALIFQVGFNLSAQTTQLRLSKHSDTASSAPAARALAQQVVSVKDKSKAAALKSEGL